MKKLNNKTLVIILVALIGIFALVRIFRAPSEQSNLKKELVKLDTAKVTQIKLLPKTDIGEITFKRDGAKWTVVKFGKEFNLDLNSVESLLGQLMNLKPKKMVSRKKEKWNDYEVGDSTTRVQVLTGDEIVADVNIGRMGLNQSREQMQQQQFGNQPFDGGFTYVRLTDEDEVYTVDGFLGSSFDRTLNDFRDKSLFRIKSEDISKITFNYPDSGFVVEKRDKKWWIDNQLADSIKVTSFISTLPYKKAASFADDFTANRKADITLVISSSAAALATLQAWKREKDWAFITSRQPNVYFSSEGSATFQSLFERKSNFTQKLK